MNKQAYLSSISHVPSKVSSFRRPTDQDKARQRRFIKEEDRAFEENFLYDSKAGSSASQKNNNLYKIKLKVDHQMMMNSNPSKREAAQGGGD